MKGGELPGSWKRTKLRHLGRIVGGGTPTSDPTNWEGDIPFATPPDLRLSNGSTLAKTDRTVTAQGAESGSSIVPPSSVLVSIRAPIGYVARTSHEVAFNQGCRALVPLSHVDARFMTYALYASKPKLDALGRGTTFMEVSGSQFSSLEVPVPDMHVQVRIGEYLDRETARIDTLIEKQEALIEALAVRRRATIARAVTRGLDDDGPTSASAHSWINDVPNHWKNGKIKNVGEVTLGKMLQSEDEGGDLLAPYLRAANVQPDGLLRPSDPKEMWFSRDALAKLDLQRGDVVVVEGGVGGFGRAAYVKEGLPGWGFQNSINRIRPTDNSDGRYITYFLLMARHCGFIRAYSNVVSMPHLTAEKLAALPVLIPPPIEQREIADFLDEQTAKIDELTSSASRFIELTKERRSTLITAAVTGQIDVRKEAVDG